MSAVIERLRAAGAHPWLEPSVALALRASTVRGSGRFVARELSRRRITARYRVRATNMTVLIRHRTPDVVTLGEVFYRPDYAPPSHLAGVLDGPAPRVLDLGANVGLFGAYLFGRWPHARLTAVEADPANAAVVRKVVALNGLEQRWEVIEAAAGARTGEVGFAAGGYSLSRIESSPGPAVQTVAMIDVLPAVAGSDLLKMDIEGGEWAILADERFGDGGPRAVVLEYHPHLCPGPTPRLEVESRLRTLGYRLESIFHRADGHGMLWAWRD